MSYRSTKVVRGGSWPYNQYRARAASRNNGVPAFRSSNLGFRVCCADPNKQSIKDRGPYCIDCKYCEVRLSPWKAIQDAYLCHKVLGVVDKKPTFCDMARTDEKLCGLEARYFEGKE